MPKREHKKKKVEETPPDEEASGGRTIWSGTISFGLVSVPVALLPAVRSERISLRMLDADGTPLRRRYYCPEDNREIHPEHIIRGYPVDDDRYITVTGEELEALEPRKSRDIDLRLFVDEASIDPIYFDRPYFLVPATESTKAYRLLVETMQRTKKAGIATFVMRDREYLVAIFAEDGLLRAQTMRFEDEIRSREDIGLPERRKADRKLVAEYERAIKKLAGPFEPAQLAREYEQKLLQLVEDKFRKKRDIVESEVAAEEAGEVSVQDLMTALEESIRASRKKRKSA